jgi:hypothetical protein
VCIYGGKSKIFGISDFCVCISKQDEKVRKQKMENTRWESVFADGGLVNLGYGVRMFHFSASATVCCEFDAITVRTSRRFAVHLFERLMCMF